ncbi:Ferrichrome-iron receptor [Nitrospira sp. KM1]|uniref:TonB-dependent siderophore receptor n=1 Tax=Nitrospira sp. KM1 TaxID=1936990 RepID=UPI0013A76205|nr:TonB-dependent receptor [Nitrospira sp. KM1]BCA56531.1 Ferrichrome-iron receptor [Nitrospira sp. KM1]
MMIPWPLRIGSCVIALAVAGILFGPAVYAQTEAVKLDIPPQDLSGGLSALAAQANIQVLYASDLVAGKTTKGVVGTVTPDEAMQQLLDGTGLQHTFTDSKTVTIQRRIPAGAALGGAAVAAEAASKPVKVPEIVVKDVRERDDFNNYVAEDSNTATRTDTPMLQVPQSVEVVTQKVMQDQRAIRVEQALRNVSGVALGDVGQSGIAADVAYCRGFPCGYFKNYLRNEDQNQALTYRDVSNMQRLEVLKGPASVLYGRSEPGGIINIITKQPQADRYASIDQVFGSYNYYRTMIDVTGPLDEGKKVLFRVNGAYENTGSFRDFVHGQRYFIAPVFLWQAGNNTTLTFEGEYIRDRRTPDFGVPAIGDRPVNMAKSTFYGEAFDTLAFEEGRAGAVLTHRFSDQWRIESRLRADISKASAYRTFALSVLPGNQDMARFFFNQLAKIQSYYWRNDVIGKVSTGSIKHEILTGVEIGRQYASYDQGFGFFDTISIYNPVHGLTPGPDPGKTPVSRNFANALGGYVQDQISVLDNFQVLIGARGDYFYQHTDLPGSEAKAENYGFSPRIGVSYQPIPQASVYANVTRSFQPNFGPFTVADNQFKPTTATQYEAGVKTVIVPDRLTSTLAIYRILKKDVLAVNPADPTGFSFVQTGAQRSQGVEFDVTAQLAQGWRAIATYAYTDARIAADTSIAVGNRIPLVARHTGSLWTTYDFQVAPLKGFGVGGGMFAVGERAGDLANTFELPGYVRADAAVYYRKPEIFPHTNLIAQLNVQNLLNQNYFYSGGQSQTSAAYWGAPVTFFGSIKLEFY